MKSHLFTFLLLFGALSGSAQFFSGKYLPDQTIDQFTHLKVHHHHHKTDKYHGDLEVKGYSDFGMLWEVRATMLSQQDAAPLIAKHNGEEAIKTVYEFKIAVDGIEEEYFLLGYEQANGHPAFIVVEEIFASVAEVDMLELKSFRLMKANDLARN